MALLKMTPEMAREWAKLEEGCLVMAGRPVTPEASPAEKVIRHPVALAVCLKQIRMLSMAEDVDE